MNQIRVKYPRTRHFLSSLGATSDDKILVPENSYLKWNHEVVISEKRDGENTTILNDGFHARSLDSRNHPSRNKIAALHSNVAHLIPDNFRICGENLTAVHSIKYTNLKSIFEIFSIWDGNTCLSWEDTVEYAALLEIPTVPILYIGPWNLNLVDEFSNKINSDTQEGFVVRPSSSFLMEDFGTLVGKWVRKNHISSNKHWMYSKIEYNELAP